MKWLRRIRRIIDRSLIRDGYSGTLTLTHRLLACAPLVGAIAIIGIADLDRRQWPALALFFAGGAGSMGLLFWMLWRSLEASARTRRSERLAQRKHDPQYWDSQ